MNLIYSFLSSHHAKDLKGCYLASTLFSILLKHYYNSFNTGKRYTTNSSTNRILNYHRHWLAVVKQSLILTILLACVLLRVFANITVLLNSVWDVAGVLWCVVWLTSALCADVDECETGTHHCSEGQICHNLPGSYRCDCQTGYQYDAIRRLCIGMLTVKHFVKHPTVHLWEELGLLTVLPHPTSVTDFTNAPLNPISTLQKLFQNNIYKPMAI